MARKKNLWRKYLIILVIAIAILIVVNQREKEYEAKVTNIFDVNPEDITAFTVSKDTVSVTLLNADTTWVFAEPDTGRVEEYRIDNFFRYVVNGKKTGFVTENPEKYEQYNVTDSLGTKVELKKGEYILESVIVGRSESSWTHDYIKYPDDKRVYMTQEKILNHLSEKASFWR
jgi:hypothetical protein